MGEAESDQGFQVRDRRRTGADSDAESTPRLIGSPAAARPAEAPASGPAPATPTAEPGRPPVGRSESPGGRSESPEGLPEAGGEAAGDERSLVGLFAMLAGLAATALEGIPDPMTGQVREDPAQAAEIIDVLLLLRDRTEGRRTLEETQALDEILYELQLGYVRATTRR